MKTLSTVTLLLLTLSSSASAEVIQIEPVVVFGRNGAGGNATYESRLFLTFYWRTFEEFKKELTPFRDTINSLALTATADTDTATINDIQLTGDDSFHFSTTTGGLTISD